MITLESVQVDASVEMHRKQLVAHMAAHARHTAEKDMKKSFSWPENLLTLATEARSEDVLANEMKIFHTKLDALQGQV